MKKLVSVALCLMLSLSLLGFTALAEPASDNVYVSISDEKGELVLAYAAVSISDEDNDGAWTINDALICAHKAYHKDGAQGFASEETVYGCSITKLWGYAEGSAYGYSLNDNSAMSCYDTIQPNDHIKAFVYTDTESFSDLYCFFNATTVSAELNDTVTLTLYANTYDANWNTVKTTVSGAEILINGKASGIMTDENGKADIPVQKRKDMTISAKSDSQTLVAPVCLIHVPSADHTMLIAILIAVIAVAGIALTAVVVIKKYNRHA